MLQKVKLENILFLDIETVAQQPEFSKLSGDFKAHSEHKANFIGKEEETPENLYSRAGIYSEFGKIVCISAGFINIESGNKILRIKSFANDDESILITDFFELLNKHYSFKDALLCAHNGKEFDFPYIARRALVNGIDIPEILDLAGKKPSDLQIQIIRETFKSFDWEPGFAVEEIVADQLINDNLIIGLPI